MGCFAFGEVVVMRRGPHYSTVIRSAVSGHRACVRTAELLPSRDAAIDALHRFKEAKMAALWKERCEWEDREPREVASNVSVRTSSEKAGGGSSA
jgi:hypothetical protein